MLLKTSYLIPQNMLSIFFGGEFAGQNDNFVNVKEYLNRLIDRKKIALHPRIH